MHHARPKLRHLRAGKATRGAPESRTGVFLRRLLTCAAGIASHRHETPRTLPYPYSSYHNPDLNTTLGEGTLPNQLHHSPVHLIRRQPLENLMTRHAHQSGLLELARAEVPPLASMREAQSPVAPTAGIACLTSRNPFRLAFSLQPAAR